MSLINKSKIALAVGMFSLLPSIGAQAAEDETYKVEFGLGVPYFVYDTDFSFNNKGDLEDKEGLKGLLGFRFGHYQLELDYDTMTTDFEAGGDEFELEQAYLNLLIFGDRVGRFEPYLGLGFGQADMNEGAFGNETTVTTFGTGFKFYFSDNVALRPSVNYFIPTELDEGYTVASLTLSFLMGSQPITSRSGKTAEPAPVAAPVDGDADSDGIVDSQDKCPATPKGVKVDTSGCPLDADGDGVPDYQDKCPGTDAKLKVDTTGCPEILKESVQIDLKVNFDSNSDVVKSQYYSEIRRVATFLEQYQGTKAVIEGHTDTQGSASYNKTLSQKRADAVAKILTGQMGVSPSRVTAIGYGEARPIADESTKEGLLANRRVVATVSTTVESEVKK